MRRLVFQEGKSNKFWEIDLQSSSVTVRFGRIGTDGQSQTKAFANAGEAQTHHDKLIAQKLKKGYVDDASSSPTTPTSSNQASSSKSIAKPAAPSAKQAAPKTTSTTQGTVSLEAVGVAAQKGDAKAIVKLLANASAAERSRIRKALLEFHGLFGSEPDEKVPKSALLKKYSESEIIVKYSNKTEDLVMAAVAGERKGSFAYHAMRSFREFRAETSELIRQRMQNEAWIGPAIKVDYGSEWFDLVDANVFPKELEPALVIVLLDSLYLDPTAKQLKATYAKHPWISDFIYHACLVENFAIHEPDTTQRLAGFLDFLEFQAEKNRLDRVRLLQTAFQGMHIVRKQPHGKGCIRVVELLAPTEAELIASQSDMCSAISMGVPVCHEFVLSLMSRLVTNAKTDVKQMATSIATALPTMTTQSAKKAMALLVEGYRQRTESRTECVTALLQSLVHAKRDVAETGWNAVTTIVSNQDKDAVSKIQSMSGHVSQVLKKQIADWIKGPATVVNLTVTTTTKQAKVSSSQSKGTTKKGLAATTGAGAIDRSPETIRAYRDTLRGLGSHFHAIAHIAIMTDFQASIKKSGLDGDDLWDTMTCCHLGMPIPDSPWNLVKRMKVISRKPKIQEDWLRAFAVSVAVDDKEWTKSLVEQDPYSLETSSIGKTLGTFYLACQLANEYRESVLPPKRSWQAALEKDKASKPLKDALDALHAKDEPAFLVSLKKAAQNHVKAYIEGSKSEYVGRAKVISEHCTLLWHCGKLSGFAVESLGTDTMSVILTQYSLPIEKKDNQPSMKLPAAKDRLTKGLKSLTDLLNSCDIPYALARPWSDPHLIKPLTNYWFLAMELTEAAWDQLRKKHDPFQVFLNAEVRDPKRKTYRVPMLNDLAHGVILEHVSLSKGALEEVMKSAQPMIQNGVSVSSTSIEHAVALALPVVEEHHSRVTGHKGKLQNLSYYGNRCIDYCKWVIQLSKSDKFDWKQAESLSRKMGTKRALDAIKKEQAAPGRFLQFQKVWG
jgi:predicted DNA-binding WGR domain protein